MNEPISPAGYLRSLHVVFDGVTTTGGPFGYEPRRYRRARNLQVRCSERWASIRCQRKRNHTGMHWWRHRHRQAWWGLPDPPFSVLTEVKSNG